MPIILPAHVEGSGTPLTRHYQYAVGQNFKRGAPVSFTAGEVVEFAGGATVTGIVGIAAFDPGNAPGNNMANSNLLLQVTGQSLRDVGIHHATRNQVFYGAIRAGVSTVDLTPAITDQRTYGIIKQADGSWTVDRSDTTDVVVRVVKVDPAAKLVWFKFLESALAA